MNFSWPSFRFGIILALLAALISALALLGVVPGSPLALWACILLVALAAIGV